MMHFLSFLAEISETVCTNAGGTESWFGSNFSFTTFLNATTSFLHVVAADLLTV